MSNTVYRACTVESCDEPHLFGPIQDSRILAQASYSPPIPVGSVLREDFRPDSDVDVLVEFEPGHTPGLDFFTMEMELSEILGRAVDLNTPGFLSPTFRDEVLAEAEVQYAEPE